MDEREFKTTFFDDFTIADRFGKDAIKDTYNRCFDGWKTNIKYFTEFVVALNWKIWEWYSKDKQIARIYDKLWQTADEYARENFKWEDLDYYVINTD